MIRSYQLESGRFLLVGDGSRTADHYLGQDYVQGGDAQVLARRLHELADQIAATATQMQARMLDPILTQTPSMAAAMLEFVEHEDTRTMTPEERGQYAERFRHLLREARVLP